MYRKKLFERLFDPKATFKELESASTLQGLEDAIISKSILRKSDTDEILARQDSALNDILLVYSGFVLGLQHTEEQLEPKTNYIWGSDSFILLDHFLDNQTLPCDLKALSGTSFFVFSRQDYDGLVNEFKFIPSLVRLQAGEDLKNSNVYFSGFSNQAIERLATLRAKYRGIENIAQRKEIASFIGITPVHLSRLYNSRTKNNVKKS